MNDSPSHQPVNNQNIRKSMFWRIVIEVILLQVATVLFYIVFAVLFANFFEEQTYRLLSTIISVAILYIWIYTILWTLAERDRNLVKYKHIKENKHKGLIIGLYSSIPGGICVILALLKALFPALPEFFMSIYRIYYSYFSGVTDILERSTPLAYIVPLLFPPAFTALGYYNGYKLFRIRDKLLYKNKKRNPKSKKLR